MVNNMFFVHLQQYSVDSDGTCTYHQCHSITPGLFCSSIYSLLAIYQLRRWELNNVQCKSRQDNNNIIIVS